LPEVHAEVVAVMDALEWFRREAKRIIEGGEAMDALSYARSVFQFEPDRKQAEVIEAGGRRGGSRLS